MFALELEPLPCAFRYPPQSLSFSVFFSMLVLNSWRTYHNDRFGATAEVSANWNIQRHRPTETDADLHLQMDAPKLAFMEAFEYRIQSRKTWQSKVIRGEVLSHTRNKDHVL